MAQILVIIHTYPEERNTTMLDYGIPFLQEGRGSLQQYGICRHSGEDQGPVPSE
jgi:hypothetical protein